MNGPRCTLCETNHWSHEPHKLGPITMRPDVMRVLGSAYKAKVVVGKTADTGPKTPDKTPDKPRTETETADTVTASCGHQAKRPARGPLPRFCSDACRKRASRT